MKEHLIEFNQLAMANAEGSDEMLNRVMTKDNIGLAALLETKDGVFESSGGMNLQRLRLDRLVLADSVDPDQTAPVCHSFCISLTKPRK